MSVIIPFGLAGKLNSPSYFQAGLLILLFCLNSVRNIGHLFLTNEVLKYWQVPRIKISCHVFFATIFLRKNHIDYLVSTRELLVSTL